MPIKATTDVEVRALVDALGADDPDRREAAIARLLIIGSRAVGRLSAAYEATTDRAKRVAILRVLEVSGDGRALTAARHAIRESGDLAVAGIAVLRELITNGSGSTHTVALEALLTLSTDTSVERRVCAAAAEALDHAPGDIREAIARALQPAPSTDDALWEDALDGRLPDEPASLRDALGTRGESTPLPLLRRMIEFVRERELAVPTSAQRAAWQNVRGALHQTVALRGSRIALYDLRETVERSTTPLPPSFLAAMHAVGDASCLEPIATAFARAATNDRWRHQLAQAFHAVAKRERLTTKHSAIRRALAKSPELAGRP
jgi:hypothetical protein